MEKVILASMEIEGKVVATLSAQSINDHKLISFYAVHYLCHGGDSIDFDGDVMDGRCDVVTDINFTSCAENFTVICSGLQAAYREMKASFVGTMKTI